MPTVTVDRSVLVGNRRFSSSHTKTAGAQLLIEETIPGPSTDLEIACPIDVSALKYLMIYSTRALTIETNDGTTPDDTLAIPASKVIEFDADQEAIFANPLGTDVTSVFVTLAGAVNAELTILAVTDPTP